MDYGTFAMVIHLHHRLVGVGADVADAVLADDGRCTGRRRSECWPLAVPYG